MIQPNNNLQNPRIPHVSAGILGLFAGFFLYQIFGGILTIAITGFTPDASSVQATRLLQIAAQILFLLLPALFLSKFVYEDVTALIRFRLPKLKELLLFLLGGLILIFVISSFAALSELLLEEIRKSVPSLQGAIESLDEFQKSVDETYTILLAVTSPLDWVVVFFLVAITPAICEEVLFRGFIQRSFELRTTPIKGILITSFFFALFHLNPIGMIPLFALSAYFGWSAVKTGSLLTPVLLHFLNNFVSFIFLTTGGDEELLQMGKNSDITIASVALNLLFFLLLFASVLIFIFRYYRKINESR